MSPVPEDPTADPLPAPWRELRETLAGSFAARARGLLASDFALLDRGGREIGHLQVRGPEGAQLEVGELRAKIERNATRRYAMLAGGSQLLSAESAGSPEIMEMRCAGHPYQARLALLRNTAEASRAEGGMAARVTGGLTNRRYEAVFDTEDEGSLPVAVFLLFHLVALRRGAYRAGVREG